MIENTEREIRSVCNEVAEMLIEKNRSYGDSALSPLRCFSKEASGIEQLNVRMDDKLSRLLRGNGNHWKEDVEKDLIGYLILKRVALKRQEVNTATGMANSADGPVNTAAPAKPKRGPGPRRDFLAEVGSANINAFIEQIVRQNEDVIDENNELKKHVGHGHGPVPIQ